MKKIIPIAVLVLAAAIFVWWQFGVETSTQATDFAECVAAGNPVMESYPRQCRDGERTFTEDIGNELDKADLIRLDSPRPNQTIESPLAISGEARGNWFFEGDFPVVLTDWDGRIIAEGIATADGEWMTTDFVPFAATLTFTVDKDVYSNRGTLILQKDNPSGLSQYDDALEIPVFFKEASPKGTGILPFKSGVTGRVLLGPTCPVMRDPPDPDCDDRPYQTTVQVVAVGNARSSPFATVETDKEGVYKVFLPPGEYVLQAIGGIPFPSCGTTNVTIGPDTLLVADLSCDTGIR
ncbi:MAG: Gmad2 immunoglobulin-like domain-containing protein [Patescibacteria group bacterium]|nr:Gmad2 immunoglobulin-like domain-containing protein [Patescibacteria group bacterium]